MSSEIENDAQLEIGHVLFIDIVGFSKLLVDEQSAATQRLNELVRNSEQFRADEAAGKLLRLPTGDGILLVFFSSPEAPARCAIHVARGLKGESFGVRMGIHSGPIHKIRDVDGRSNLAGTGVNLAQRVMDCGDANHILLSRRAAEDLEQHSKWRPRLHDLGTFEVKHGVKIDIVSLHDAEIGNSRLPEKLKGKRISSAKRMAKLLVVAALFLAIGISYWVLLQRSKQKSAAASAVPEKSVAILPFRPLSSKNRDEVLENGMADTLIAKLSTVTQIIIPSLASAQKYAEQEHDPVAAGRLLHVRSVLDGTLQKVADHIRVTARLINVGDGASMWSATFDEKFTDVFAVQDTIAQKVANALALRLNANEQQRLTKRYTENTAAYQLYLKGRFYWNKFTEDDFKRAIDYYNQALQIDPTYALAYAGLASSYIQLGVDYNSANESLPKAKAYALKALEIDEKLPEAHCALGTYYTFFERALAPAEKELKRAIELNPNYPDVHHYYCHWFETQGRMDEGIAEMKRGLDLDPLSLLIGEELGWAYYHARRYDDAVAQLQKTKEFDRNFLINYWTLAQVYEQMGKHQEAINEAQKLRTLPGGDWSESLAELGCAFAYAGNKTEAEKIIQQLHERSAREYVSAYVIATIYVALGDKDKTMEWLEKAVPEQTSYLALIRVEPKFDPMRSDPRFVDFVQRVAPH